MTTPLPLAGSSVLQDRSNTAGGGAVQNSATATQAQTEESARKIRTAAREFEAVFLRQMLSALERTTRVGDKGPTMAGQQTYGSMVVEAVADAVAQSGGLGLAKLLADNLIAKNSAQVSQGTRTDRGQPGVNQSMGHAETGGAVSESTDPAARKNSAQGLSSNAVPRTEIRTISAHEIGQLADRRIR